MALLNLATTAQLRDAFRPHEWLLAHMAMHEGVGNVATAGELLEELCER